MYTYYKCFYDVCQMIFHHSISISSKWATCFGSAFHTDKMESERCLGRMA